MAPETLATLQRARAAGKKLILITGRTLDDLRAVFREIPVFDLVVGENGAVLLDPRTASEEALCPPLPVAFVNELQKRKVPFSAGKRVLATHRPYEITIQKVIRELRVDINVILNRESVMILPGGIDKGFGFDVAVGRLRVEASEIVGIGDAENDSAFLRRCGFSVAVANAIDSLKREVEYVTEAEDGGGASEIIEPVIAGGSFASFENVLRGQKRTGPCPSETSESG